MKWKALFLILKSNNFVFGGNISRPNNLVIIDHFFRNRNCFHSLWTQKYLHILIAWPIYQAVFTSVFIMLECLNGNSKSIIKHHKYALVCSTVFYHLSTPDKLYLSREEFDSIMFYHVDTNYCLPLITKPNKKLWISEVLLILLSKGLIHSSF